MSRRKVKMRELCLYKNEIICIDGTIKIFENQIGESPK